MASTCPASASKAFTSILIISMFCFIFCFPDAQKYTNEQYLVISQWYMDVSVLKVAASGATSGGNDPPPIRDRHAPIRQSPVKGNVRGRFIIPCRVSREPTFASVHGISFSPRFSPITFSSLFFMPRSAVWKSVVSSKGSYGAHAAARSGRGAVCRKIFLFPCGRAYFPTKSCSSYPRHLLMLPKQIPSIPAPLRHKKKCQRL